MYRRTFLAIFAFLFTSFGALAASGLKPYSEAAFSQALKSGKTMVVHVHADWCPVCRKQQPTIQSLSADPAMAKVDFVRVNFDNDRDFLKANKVASQATILVFRGGKEVARLNGVTDPAEIKSKVQKAAG